MRHRPHQQSLPRSPARAQLPPPSFASSSSLPCLNRRTGNSSSNPDVEGRGSVGSIAPLDDSGRGTTAPAERQRPRNDTAAGTVVPPAGPALPRRPRLPPPPQPPPHRPPPPPA